MMSLNVGRPMLVGGRFARRSILLMAVAGLLAAAAHATEPESASPEADQQLRELIELRLSALPEQEGAKIKVAVRAGQVLLQGEVRLLEQSLRAEQSAWKTPGVSDVDNELKVASKGVSGDAAIEQQVRLVIKTEERFADTNLELEVVAGWVKLRGFFQDPADVLSLKHRIASIPGVLAVEIDALLVARQGVPRPGIDSKIPRRWS